MLLASNLQQGRRAAPILPEFYGHPYSAGRLNGTFSLSTIKPPSTFSEDSQFLMYRMFENIYVKYETFYYSQLAAPVQIKLMQINNNHHKLKNEEKIFSQAGLGLVGTF